MTLLHPPFYPGCWRDLQEALSAFETGTYSGLGFMITPPLVMVDLDNSFDRATRTVNSVLELSVVNLVDGPHRPDSNGKMAEL
jgi:hypothetical protein